MSKKSKAQREIMVKADDTASPTITVKTKKRGGCGTFVLGFVFAFVLMLVVVVGTGLYMYYNVSIKTVENLIGVTIPIEGDIKKMALKDLIAKKDKLVNASLETLNTEFKIDLPKTIPGTEISLVETYDETVTFLGETKKVKEFRVQDIANNLSAFVDVVLPKLYDHVTVEQITKTAGTTILDDLDYPATKDAFYNIGTETEPNYKTLSELTITQTLDLLPKYFGSENLTVQTALDATGSKLMPKPESETEVDIYAGLRGLKIKDISTDTLKTKITGAILLDWVDLTGYDFLQTEEFKATTLNEFGNYIKSVSLGEFVELETVVSGDETAVNKYFAKQQYKNLARNLKLADVREAILNLKLNQIFNATDLAKLQTQYSNTDVTVEEFFTTYQIPTSTTFEQATTDPITKASAIDWESYGGYVDVIKGVTAGNYKTELDKISLQNLLGGNDLVGPIAQIGELTIREVIESDNAVDTLLSKFGTLGDLIGSGNDDGIFGIIKNVTIQDLLDKPAEAITSALKDKKNTKTLRQLLNVTVENENAIITAVMDKVTVSQLFTNGSSAITDAISTKTLGDMMNITETTGFVSLLKNVSLGDLMGDNAVSALKKALTTKSGGTAVTLGEFLEIDTTNAGGILNKMAGLSMVELLGDGTTKADPKKAIQGVIDSLTLEDVFGAYDELDSDILKEMYDMTITTPGTTEGRGTMLVSEAFEGVENVKLSTVAGSGDSKPKIFTLIANYDDLTIGTIKDLQLIDSITVGSLITAGIITDNGYSEEFKAMSIQDIVDAAAKSSVNSGS